MAEADPTIAQLRDSALREGPPFTEGLTPEAGPPVFGPLVATGENVGAHGGEYALSVESVFEGYLLHYARGRVVDPADEDMRLLGGDFLYANGLTRLAGLGDTRAIADLADLIARCAGVHARDTDPFPWTGALWALTTLAIGSGRWPQYEPAKQLAGAGNPSDLTAVEEAAQARASEIGLELELGAALIVFKSVVFGTLRQT